MTRTTAADLIAGLSIAGLLLPEAVAYSGLAGLPPQAGVVALFAGLICYGLIGTSRVAIVSATSSSAAVLASAIAALGAQSMEERLALDSVLIVGSGLAFLLCAAFRLGVMTNVIARPVLRGYTFGLALVIAVKQWPHLANVPVHSSSFFPFILEILGEHRAWQLPSLGCGLLALAALFLFERLPRLPGALVVIVAGILAAPLLAARGVVLTGPIQLTLSIPAFTAPPGIRALPLVEYSLAIMFILYAESYGSIRTFALKHDETVQPNRDLLALGVANMLAGLLQGTPVGAGYSATSANDAAGARSRLAGLTAAALLLVVVLAFLHWIERVPQPVLAAIVIHAVSKSLRIGIFSDYFRWQRDRFVAIAAVVSVLLFGVLNGLLVAIGLTIALLLRSMAQPRLAVLGRVGEHDYLNTASFPAALALPDIMVLRLEEPLFFANAEPLLAQVRQRVSSSPATRVLVLSLDESPDLDSTSLEALAELCAWLERHGVELRLARLHGLARDALTRAAIPQVPATALHYASVDDAVRGHSVTP
ncbi:MAG TPA: SulP family inorganic anion transporter [Steroidobacteraceae bacterium]|nr:SulP family inorganic anion transporter [Steroidobacteraceae bacterium]